MSKRAITEEAFDKLLRWLDPDRDMAGERYEVIRRRLVGIFSAKGCYEAEDLADETINVVASKSDWLIENYNGDKAVYFFAVAKKIYLERIKPRPKPLPPPAPPDRVEIERVSGCLDQCLEELPAAERKLVLQYQEGERQDRIKNRKRLAEELGISTNALRIKVFYIHSDLRRCIQQRLKELPEL
jgi:DNA-directed RNA polymerase specialized sigma24 family protein